MVQPPLLSIFCRWPAPGEAKTRLIPRFGAVGAAAVYAALLAHTIAVARGSGLPFALRVTGADEAAFHARFGADLMVVPQGAGDLSDRLLRVPPPALVIGSDCPGLTAAILHEAAAALERRDAVIGPARDGGYYLIGYRSDARFALVDMPWSTPAVLAETQRRFADRGIVPQLLPELADIDEPADLADWPEFLP